MWFKKLVGFEENNPNQVRESLLLDGEFIVSKINNKRMRCGKLTIPTLKELRDEIPELGIYTDKLSINEVVGDVKRLHKENPNATFQAASQFNLLEMASPYVTPEQGVDIYETDYTQGPACAITCGAGTIYRNYFVEIGEQVGQTRDKQVDCLKEIGDFFNNDEMSNWKMENGYAFATKDGLRNISNKIKGLKLHEYEDLKSKLRVGIQSNTEITILDKKQYVTQVYCSALPIGYTRIETKEWELFARLILEGTYEATFYAALKNFESTGNNQLYLTLVGGGVFGNPIRWVLDAIEKSVAKFKNTPLDVHVVSYGGSKKTVKEFLSKLN
jgi:hypothetical protein